MVLVLSSKVSSRWERPHPPVPRTWSQGKRPRELVLKETWMVLGYGGSRFSNLRAPASSFQPPANLQGKAKQKKDLAWPMGRARPQCRGLAQHGGPLPKTTQPRRRAKHGPIISPLGSPDEDASRSPLMMQPVEDATPSPPSPPPSASRPAPWRRARQSQPSALGMPEAIRAPGNPEGLVSGKWARSWSQAQAPGPRVGVSYCHGIHSISLALHRLHWSLVQVGPGLQHVQVVAQGGGQRAINGSPRHGSPRHGPIIHARRHQRCEPKPEKMNLKRGPTASFELEPLERAFLELSCLDKPSVVPSPTANEPRLGPAHVSDAKWAMLTELVRGGYGVFCASSSRSALSCPPSLSKFFSSLLFPGIRKDQRGKCNRV
ncbi:hypothetical protein B0J13DRAFT_134414 [Dactylonectria estremocensis]|uniref:Uncharacterized protein n=1 Tax=Dactylonectria estremocensis TaxID=1079267 RepID=A0A9P9E0K3_9HYPO|nr:hypothetical protein B0J13DRAFT_134414 [Dactylonectria estremocensis]